MKKIIALICAVTTCFSLVACGGSEPKKPELSDEEKVFSDLYQSRIDVAKSENILNVLENGVGEEDPTSIYIEKAYFLDASESAEEMFDIYTKLAKEIDISYISE